MRVILIANSKYEEMLKSNLARLHDLRYPSIVVRVADDVDFLNLKLGKPTSVLEELEKTPEGKLLCYLDADAFIIKPVPEIESDTTADVFLTYHGGNQRTINSGVYFLRSNSASKRFMQQWCDKIEERGSTLPEHRQGDQAYLNDLIHTQFKKGTGLRDTVRDFNGIRIKFLDADVYNSNKAIYNKNILSNAKIVHVHASTREIDDPNQAVANKLRSIGI